MKNKSIFRDQNMIVDEDIVLSEKQINKKKINDRKEKAISKVRSDLGQTAGKLKSIRQNKKNKNDENIPILKKYPNLLAIKPREKYIFHSDYFTIDNYYACILAFFHRSGAQDHLAPFWGIDMIPSGLPEGVTTINFEQIERMPEKWISEHSEKAFSVANQNSAQKENSKNIEAQIEAVGMISDMNEISRELQNGASYLNVHNRILVKAPSLEMLDKALQMLKRMYEERFATIWAAPYQGDQRKELSTLFSKNGKKRGKGFYYTSSEYAGAYGLVTHGLEDPNGEYIGRMTGDVNSSAILFDVDGFKKTVVVASELTDRRYNDARLSDMWGSKIALSALAAGHRVVHIILNDCNLSDIGPEMKDSTIKIDLSQGEVNPFEVFGRREDSQTLYAWQIQKMINFTEQAAKPTEEEKTMIALNLEKALSKFYIDNGMWIENAPAHKERLRLVGDFPHDQVPKLIDFVNRLATMKKAAVVNEEDPETIRAITRLHALYSMLLSSNGDIFNTSTTPKIDHAKTSRRVIYDFADLMKRGKGIAMAQFVNVIGFAMQNLQEGDVIIFHGAQNIDENVRKYVNEQLTNYYDHSKGRTVFLYDSINKMMDDITFNEFDKADYTILTNMLPTQITTYQELLKKQLPADMASLISDSAPSSQYTFIHRGIQNVVFSPSLMLKADERRRL